MIVNETNVEFLPKKDIELCTSLLYLLSKLNVYIKKKIEIRFQDWHDTLEEYPDYYGTYRLLCGDTTIGLEMNIDEVDTVLSCMLEMFEIQNG